MHSQILKFDLLKNVDPGHFERTLKETILPKLKILRRAVSGQSFRLFRTDSDHPVYVCLVFTKLVGSSPETAGKGPEILCEGVLPIDALAGDLAKWATMTVLDEL